MTPPRIDRYRNVAAAVSALAEHVDLYAPADGTDPDAPQFPLAAWLLVALEDLSVLVGADPTLDDDAAADLAADLAATWADLSTAYDRRAARTTGDVR